MTSSGTGNHGNKVAPGDKRLHIEGLMPGTKYAVQVRAVDNKVDSKWSGKYHIETIEEGATGSTTPPVPQLTSFNCDSGQFVATWNTVNTYDDGVSVMVVNSYEIELVSQFGTIISPHYGTATTTQSRSWSFSVLRALFGGNLPTTLTARLRVLSSARTPSEWSEPITASAPVPNPPTNPKAESVIDGVKVTWEPPTDPIHLYGYRVYAAIGEENAGFIPSTMSLVYQGGALEFTYGSSTYDHMHYFKIVSYSEPGLESTWVEASAKPKSPYGPDLIAPTKPVLDDPAMDKEVVNAPKANLAWTHDDTVEPNKDTAGFVVRWRIVGETRWRNAYFSKEARNGVIDLPQPFANYEFEISAYDFVANYSDYAGTLKTLTGADPNPPAAVTGVTSIPRWDGLKIQWNESNESVKYGGFYEIQYNTSGTWAEDAPVNFDTTALSIDITNLAPLTTYHYRVRAVDTALRRGPWSTTASVKTPAFPTAAATDGAAPPQPPGNVRSTGGLNYINISWDRVQNADEVWYEVFASKTSGFTTLDETTFVGESSGTSLMVTGMPNPVPGQPPVPLAQDTTYYFKVRAMDMDCLIDPVNIKGPVSAQVSNALTQVLSTDLGINMGGENLLFNSSFNVDSGGVGTAILDGVADYWEIWNPLPGAEPTTNSLVTGRNSEGKAQRVSWSGVASMSKGVRSINSPVLARNTEYMLSFYARSNGQNFSLSSTNGITGVVPDPENGTPSTTVWKRYIFKFSTQSTAMPNNVTITNLNSTTGGWFEIDDAQIEAGNVASMYKTGTVSIAKLVSGKFTTADMIISTGGRIVSEAYLSNQTKGFLITDQGITIKEGAIDAKTLIANTTITSNLYVGALLEISAGGANNGPGQIRSANYHDGSPVNGQPKAAAGFRIDAAGIDIRSGTVAANTFSGGTVSANDINIGNGGRITLINNGQIRSGNYSYVAKNGTIPERGTGWMVGWNPTTSTYGIEMWDKNSKISANALVSSTLETTVLTIGSGGEIRSSNWDTGIGARWQLMEGGPNNTGGFTMYNGAITGAVIRTGALTSINQVPGPSGTLQPAFDINAGGYTSITGLRLYGNAIMGNNSNNYMQSENYSNAGTGWKIWGSGEATFKKVKTYDLFVDGDAIVSKTAANNLRSESFSYNAGGDGGNGWIMRGDGYAEFNAGMFSVGHPGGGRVMATLDSTGANATLRFYQPGNTTRYGSIRQRVDNVLEMRGGWGGAITFNPAWFTGRTVVQIAQDLDVLGFAQVDNGFTITQGGLNIKGGGIAVTGGINVRNGGLDVDGADFISRANNNTLTKSLWLGGVSEPNGGGKRELLLDSNNLVIGGQQRGSTIRIKDDVVDFTYSKEQVLSLRPVHYKLKDELWDDSITTKENSYSGVIAEEALEAGLDDFVLFDEEGLPDDFDYQRFTSALLHVAREQQKEIEELQSAVKKLLAKS